MKTNSITFGFNRKIINSAAKRVTPNDIIRGITDTIKQTTPQEKVLLSKALGINKETLEHWKPEFEIVGGDILTGKMFPGIHITTKGASLIDSIGNIIRCELAKIRGEIKPISIDEMKF